MTNLPANKVLDGEVLGLKDSCYKVTYWRHYRKQVFEAATIEDCIDFIYYGKKGGHLASLGSHIENMAGDIVLTSEKLTARLEKLDEEKQ